MKEGVGVILFKPRTKSRYLNEQKVLQDQRTLFWAGAWAECAPSPSILWRSCKVVKLKLGWWHIARATLELGPKARKGRPRAAIQLFNYLVRSRQKPRNWHSLSFPNFPAFLSFPFACLSLPAAAARWENCIARLALSAPLHFSFEISHAANYL